jgi:hypothetical protein
MLDNSGNIITTGTFTDSLNVGTATVYAGNGSANSGYVLKLSPAGNAIWAHGGKDGGDGFSVAVDQNDNVYYGYSYRDFNTSYVFSADVVKYSSGGTQLWLTTLNGAEQTEIVTDNANTPYVAAHLRDTSMLGTTSYTPTGSEEVAVMKMDAAAGTINWIKNFEGAPGFGGSNFLTSIGYSSSLGVVVNAYGHIDMNSTSYTSDQLFSFDANGNLNWATTAPGNVIQDMWIDQSDLYFTGHESVSSSNHDIYTSRMSQVTTGIHSFSGEELTFYPNPSSGWITVEPNSMGTAIELEIFNGLGEKVSSLPVAGKTRVSLSLEPGIYFVQWTVSDKRVAKKLVIE